MLSSLQIENVAVIQKAEVHFEPGLNVLTGETGAGKSILIDSINAILGSRTSKDLVRTGAAKAVIRAAFEQVDPDLIYAARTLGMKERTIFWRVVMPAAGPGVASGTVLTFARALGEYGATAMLAGNIAGKTGTISQKIANVIKDGDYATAGVWVVIMLVIALVIIMVINYLSGGKNRKQNRW